MPDVGTTFVSALAAKDTEALLALFAHEVDFRALTPTRFWRARTPDEVVNGTLYRWFDADDVIEGVLHVEPGRVADRRRVDYRFRVRNPEGLFEVEQRAYYDTDPAGRVTQLHVMCAGFRPVGEPPA